MKATNLIKKLNKLNAIYRIKDVNEYKMVLCVRFCL